MMGFWPFSRRKKAISTEHQQQGIGSESHFPRSINEKSAAVTPVAPPMTPKSQQPTPRSAISLASAREPPKPAVNKSSTAPTVSTSAKRRTLVKKNSRPGDDEAARQPLAELRNQRQEGNSSRTSLSKDADFSAVPTLKPSGQDGKSLRSKKSIRSKGDKERIKSLQNGSSPIPIPGRPLSDANGELMVRESRRVSGGFGRPASQVSLPLAESLRDEYIPDAPESTSYKVNAFDVFAPRPTIKYTTGSRPNLSRKDKAPMISQGDFGPKARINELADDMDAHGLRELMDRDRRRRERKRKLDSEKLARQLEKKDEKEKEKRPKSRSKSKSKSKGKERATTEGRTPGGAEAKEARSRSATPEALPTIGGPLGDNPFVTTEELEPISPVHDKFRESRYSPVSAVEDSFAEPISAVSDKEEPVVETIETAKAIRLSQASMSPPASPILEKKPSRAAEHYTTSTPDIPELPEPQIPGYTAPSPEPLRRGSEATQASSNRAGGGWTSFFRRTKTRTRTSSERGRNTPESGFSNTSRESFRARTGQSTGPSAAALIGAEQRSFRRSGTPQRTQSKFREELPDVPKVPEVPVIPASVPTGGEPISPPRSPPISRGASPDPSSPPSPYVDRPEMLSTDAAVNAPMEIVHPALRGDVALSRHQSMRSNNGFNGQRDSGPSAALLSQSLASVDSEGSWLSGRPSKRSSSVTARGSKTSLPADAADQDSTRASPLIFGRRISNPGQRPGTGSISTQFRQLQKPSIAGSGTGTPPEHSKPPTPIHFGGTEVHGDGDKARGDVDSGEALLHTSGIARTPTLVNRERSTNTRSREGLLDIFDPRPKSSSAAIELADATSDGEQESTPSSPIQPPPRNPLRGSVSTARQTYSGNETDDQPRPSTGESPGDEMEQAQFAEAQVVQMADATEIKRATSVSLRNRTHARQMSAGSARLLDLPARGSGELSRSERRRDREIRRESWVDTPTTPSIPAPWRTEAEEEKENTGDKSQK